MPEPYPPLEPYETGMLDDSSRHTGNDEMRDRVIEAVDRFATS